MTQFEGTYARMMFPGFDEPAFKATFELSVIADKGDTAISNGRIVKDEPLPGSTRHKHHVFHFAPDVHVSCCARNRRLAMPGAHCRRRPIRVCAEPDKKQYGQFALEAAAQSVHFYNQWYGIKYPFEKLDMLAIPDYEWGGMENTASIFYRDTALLMDEKTASAFGKRSHATVVAHEIAHQWFGDLVPPRGGMTFGSMKASPHGWSASQFGRGIRSGTLRTMKRLRRNAYRARFVKRRAGHPWRSANFG